MNSRQEKADKANQAACAIGEALTQTVDDLRSTLITSYELDDQLITLAIAKASVSLAAEATSEIAGMETDECAELEERLYEVIFDAISDLESA